MTTLKRSTACPPHKTGAGQVRRGTVTLMNESSLGYDMLCSSVKPSYANKFRVWGGEGERDGAEAGEPSVNVNVNPSPEVTSKDNGKSDTTDDGGDDRDNTIRDLQAKLDSEKKQRIKLQRERDKTVEDTQAAAQDVEVERDTYKEKYEKLLKYVETDAIDTAILKNKKYEWHDVEAVRAFIDKDNIRLDLDSTTIDGIDLELKRLAKEKPYLLVSKDERDGTPKEEFTPKDQRGTGTHPFGGSASQRETDKQKLGAKYKIPGFGPGSTARPM